MGTSQRQELDALEPLVLVALRRVSHLSMRCNAANLSEVEAVLFEALLALGKAHTLVCDRRLQAQYSSAQLALDEQPENLPF
jgi:hypothetical protein